MEKFRDSFSGVIFGCIEDNNDRAQHTLETSNLCRKVQAFLEKDGRQHCADHDGKRAERSDENSRYYMELNVNFGSGWTNTKGIRDKVCQFSNAHENHPGPPHLALQVCMAIAWGMSECIGIQKSLARIF